MKKRILAMLLAVVMVTALLPFGASAEGKKLIALTFDDGPSQYTESLLDGLKEPGARGRTGTRSAATPTTIPI